MTMPDIHSMSEADTRTKLIDPVLHRVGWTEEHIKREETAGTIEIIAGVPRQCRDGRTDYTLRLRVNAHSQPVAVAIIEAKKASLHPSLGLEQCKSYCRRLNVPFVFASNGFLFVEYDHFTGLTSAPRPLADFPTPAALQARYEQGKGFKLSSPEAKPLLTPYHGGEAQRRYYQDAAIRAVLERTAQSTAKGMPARALLSLATGAGKTFIAVNLMRRIADAGLLKRALFLCDRDELRTQGLKAFQGAFGGDAAEAFRVGDGSRSRNNAANARVHIVTYQTLGIDSEGGDESFMSEFYPENYFSHIIIDECHRSAWGKWSRILTRNPDAVQIGLTATPRELDVPDGGPEVKADEKITADNMRYFGDPCYEYDMAQAMEDGYLAACVIQKGRVNLDDTGITKAQILARNPRDALTGQPVTAEKLDRIYQSTAYEDRILLPDRVLAMCQDFFNYLLATGGPEQKTILFCARDRHADDVAAQLNNLYATWCAANGRERAEPYAFKCTANSSGNLQLPDLRGASRSHFIATTVDLLTTGVDVPAIRNIGFFRYINSPISFYQMVGRGTRLDRPSGKLMFTVYDYTNATRLFGQAFVTKLKKVSEPKDGPGPAGPPRAPGRRGRLRRAGDGHGAVRRGPSGRSGDADPHRAVPGGARFAPCSRGPDPGRLPQAVGGPAVAAGAAPRPGGGGALARGGANAARDGRLRLL